MKLYLQNIIDDISFETLPITWQGFDFERFSKDKTLFDFQQDALKNVLSFENCVKLNSRHVIGKVSKEISSMTFCKYSFMSLTNW